MGRPMAIKDRSPEKSRRFDISDLPIFGPQDFTSLSTWREDLAVASDFLTDSFSAISCLADFSLVAPSRFCSIESLLGEYDVQADITKHASHCSRGPPLVDNSTITSLHQTSVLYPTDTASTTPGLLPISPSAVNDFLTEKTLEVISSNRASRPFIELCDKQCRLMVRSLNFLACAGWSESPICLRAPKKATDGQLKTLNHCFEAAIHFLDSSVDFVPIPEIRKLLDTMRIGYQGEFLCTRRELIFEKVIPAWPKLGSACILPIIDYIQEELVDDISDPTRCLKPMDQWPITTPRSKVYASDDEWYSLVKHGAKLGLFGAIGEERLFKNQLGDYVLNGAMGVDKIKVVDGKTQTLLRFISNFVPINQYLRKLRGDSSLLPSVTQLSLILLSDGELLSMESEDMESCFNLFYTPDCWAGYFAYEKQVPASAFGGSPLEWTYVYIRAVPMGCTFAVDLMQSMARRFVFRLCGVPESSEMRRDRRLPPDDVSVVCMDGFDFFRKVPLSEFLGPNSLGETEEHEKFVKRCKEIGLPLNAGKSLVRCLQGNVLGGELDGSKGTLQHSRSKGHKFLQTTLALLAMKSPSQAALQHWAGTACFAAGFRRPIFSVLEEIFTFIGDPGWNRASRRRMPLPVFDEILVFTSLLPLCYTNLRAQVRPLISISDASEGGGGAAEASCFLEIMSKQRAKATEDWFAAVNEEGSTVNPTKKSCVVCGSDCPAWNSWASCAMGCVGDICSLSCLLTHAKSCKATQLPLPKFGEGFCGPRAPLTWAMAVSDIAVIKPFDKAFDDKEDFFSSNPEKRFNNEHLAVEHWGPDCKLMSAARGRPIKLPSGNWVAGPQALRSEEFPLGLPSALKRPRCRERLVRSNAMFNFSLKRLQWRLANWGFGCLEHPLNSLGWWFPIAVQLLRTKGIFFTVIWNCCHGGRRKKGTGLMHNMPLLHAALHSPQCLGYHDHELLEYGVKETADGSLLFDTEEEAEYPFSLCLAYAKAVKATIREWSLMSIPPSFSLRARWMEDMLLNHATKLLSKQEVTDDIMPTLVDLLQGMEPGAETDHLHELLRMGDFRGTDVILCSQTPLDTSRQIVPYPAFAWKWQTVQSYEWKQAQHINALEFTALLNYVRRVVAEPSNHSLRCFHVLDSRVSSCIVAKGRSSSRIINRLCRRLAAFTLASDTYFLPLWTISKWNFSDAASRHHPPDV